MKQLKFLKTASLLAAAAFALPGVTLAQAGAAPTADQAKVKAMAQDYQAAAQELASIREATYKANPELAEQRDAFQSMIEERMEENGYDADDKLERMKEIASQLKAEDIEEAKKQQLVQEFQQERQKLLSAQQEALAESNVKEAGEKLQQDTLAAMKAQNKKTTSLLERLTRLRKDLQEATTNG